jgi:hypothetical protein
MDPSRQSDSPSGKHVGWPPVPPGPQAGRGATSATLDKAPTSPHRDYCYRGRCRDSRD